MSSADNSHKFCYKLYINGQEIARFIEAENIYMEEAEIKDNRNIILRKGTGDGTFSQWWEEVLSGKVRKRLIELWLLYSQKNAMAKWSLVSAWPTRCQIADNIDESDEKIELLELAYRRLQKDVIQSGHDF